VTLLNEPDLPAIHEDGQRDLATGELFDGCGGTLVHRGEDLICSACGSEVWRRCSVGGLWYDQADAHLHRH
jgi:hypothetical protein